MSRILVKRAGEGRIESMIECSECGEEVPVDEVVYCSYCGIPLCDECGAVGLCSTCEETWEAEEDLEMEEETY